jgi:hypothetical protein
MHFSAAATSFNDEIVPVHRFPTGEAATKAGRAKKARE